MTSRRSRILVSVVGVLAVTLYASFAAVQILVLNPLAAAPGLTLDDIRALMGLVEVGVEGAIAGTALYTGQFTLEDALALTQGR